VTLELSGAGNSGAVRSSDFGAVMVDDIFLSHEELMRVADKFKIGTLRAGRETHIRLSKINKQINNTIITSNIFFLTNFTYV
jgi:hypothetical protein